MLCFWLKNEQKTGPEKYVFQPGFFSVFKADTPFCLYVAEFMLKG